MYFIAVTFIVVHIFKCSNRVFNFDIVNIPASFDVKVIFCEAYMDGWLYGWML